MDLAIEELTGGWVLLASGIHGLVFMVFQQDEMGGLVWISWVVC
jgi:hypothetical protein